MAKEEDKLETTSGDVPSKGNGKDEEDYEIEVLEPDDRPILGIEAPSVSEEISKLEKQLEDLRKEKEDIYDRLLRKQADFENYRKRTEKDKREFQRYALAEFMLELVAILDNFERALSHPHDPSELEYWKGIELIYRQLRDLTEKKGLRAIQTDGQAFDPNYHEAITRELRNDIPENTILEELQKGYLFHEKLLRPALVKVSFQQNEEVQQNPEQDQENTTDHQSKDGCQNNES